MCRIDPRKKKNLPLLNCCPCWRTVLYSTAHRIKAGAKHVMTSLGWRFWYIYLFIFYGKMLQYGRVCSTAIRDGGMAFRESGNSNENFTFQFSSNGILRNEIGESSTSCTKSATTLAITVRQKRRSYAISLFNGDKVNEASARLAAHHHHAALFRAVLPL